jgi:hypothetical protein
MATNLAESHTPRWYMILPQKNNAAVTSVDP